MGILDWLLGKPKSTATKWSVSENGNAMIISGSTRITVFPSDRGWKYCIADVKDREEPCFSEVYESEQAARDEALAHFHGQPSRHEPLSAQAQRRRKGKWEEVINQREDLIQEIRSFLAAGQDHNITALRKPETKIASHLKQLDWQITEYHLDGVSENLIGIAERQQVALSELANEVADKIAAKQAIRKPRRAPVSASTLTDELKTEVDDLTRAFEEAPVLSYEERDKLMRTNLRRASKRMLDEGQSFGQATGGPAFLHQDESEFREFMKKVDQDLAWQCDTVSTAFERYLQIGEVPAPHYPMRIAVLLRKAKDFDRERRFLAAWCRHFPSGNGRTYQTLVERAKKVNAFGSPKN